jgi:hypothetical protein
MSRSYSPVAGVAIASLAAGPVFTIAFTLASFHLRLPQPTVIAAGDVLPWFATLFASVILGAIVAFVPNVVGCAVMAVAAESSRAARSPEAWIAVGAGAGTALALGFGLSWSPALFFATVATATVCAAICRSLAALD